MGKRYSKGGGQPASSKLSGRSQSTGMRQLIICCLISVALLTGYVREGDSGPFHTVRGVVGTVAAPVRIVGSVIALPFNAVGNAMGNLAASPETLSDLKKENASLKAQVTSLKEAQKTADRLQGLLDLKNANNLKSTAARIIGGTGSAWSKAVTIDKGSIDGISTGMAVCSSGGVIGQVIEVSASTSTVRLITDESSSVSAMLQGSRAQGMLQGQPDGSLRLSYVEADATVSEGDAVITSGIGGVFPKGLPIGTVSSVSRADNATYYTIVVRALSSAETDEEVLVITSLGTDQAASDQEVADANAAPQGQAADASQQAANSSEDGDGSSSANASNAATSSEGASSTTQDTTQTAQQGQ